MRLGHIVGEVDHALFLRNSIRRILAVEQDVLDVAHPPVLLQEHPAPIDQFDQGLAHARVCNPRERAVAQLPSADAEADGAEDDLAFPLADELFVERRCLSKLERPDGNHVDVAGEHANEEGVGVTHEAQYELVDPGLSQEIVVVRSQGHEAAANPFLQPVRAQADPVVRQVAAARERRLVSLFVERPQQMGREGH